MTAYPTRLLFHINKGMLEYLLDEAFFRGEQVWPIIDAAGFKQPSSRTVFTEEDGELKAYIYVEEEGFTPGQPCNLIQYNTAPPEEE